MQLDADRSIDSRSVVGVDLFAGAGGFSLGAMLAGVDIMAAVEIDPKACATYRTNLIETGLSRARLFQTDIMHLKPQVLLNRLGLEPGRCDILLGGPPCQGFSSHRLNGSGVGDPRNNLLLRYFEFVDVVRPKFFLVENVPGMLWPRHQQYVDSFYDMAEKIGYRLPPPHILNAGSYGVPQSRRRIFLLGTDRTASLECEWPPSPTHIAPNQEAPGDTRPSWRPASVVFDRAAHPGDENDIHMRHSPELVAAFERTPINGGSRSESGRLLSCHRSHDGHSDVYGRINPSVPGPTMTTACINPSKGRFVHPTEAHGITLRQAARFQTFPDWYVFKGGLMAGGVQVGNAVPVDMARALLTPLARTAAASRSAVSPTS